MRMFASDKHPGVQDATTKTGLRAGLMRAGGREVDFVASRHWDPVRFLAAFHQILKWE